MHAGAHRVVVGDQYDRPPEILLLRLEEQRVRQQHAALLGAWQRVRPHLVIIRGRLGRAAAVARPRHQLRPACVLLWLRMCTLRGGARAAHEVAHAATSGRCRFLCQHHGRVALRLVGNRIILCNALKTDSAYKIRLHKRGQLCSAVSHLNARQSPPSTFGSDQVASPPVSSSDSAFLNNQRLDAVVTVGLMRECCALLCAC